MTENPSRRTLMRALAEDPTYDHQRDVGRILYLPDEMAIAPAALLDEVVQVEAAHPRNLLAQTKVTPRDLELTLDVTELNARTGQQFIAVIHTDAELDAAIAAALED